MNRLIEGCTTFLAGHEPVSVALARFVGQRTAFEEELKRARRELAGLEAEGRCFALST